MKNRFILSASLSFALLTVIGCAPDPIAQPQVTNGTFPTTPGQTLTPLGGTSSSALNAILGNYGGTVYRSNGSGGEQSQPYSFTISMTPGGPTAGSNLIGTIQFSSSGPLGTINTGGELRVGINGLLNGYDTDGVPIYVYSLTSAIVSSTVLSEYPFIFELIFSLKNGSTFVPSQSQIDIRECVLYPSSSVCNTESLTVRFGTDLGKR